MRGRFTVLNFFSMGCGFCIREIPENNELAEWIKSRGGRFLAIHSATAESGAAKDPGWGGAIKGQVSLVAEYG